jgi:hypothetical protein
VFSNYVEFNCGEFMEREKEIEQKMVAMKHSSW